MIATRNLKPGFTLFEVLAALFMIGMLLSSVMVLQQQSFSSIINSSKKLMVALVAHQALSTRIIESIMGAKEKNEKPIAKESAITAEVSEKSIKNNSALKDFKQMKQFVAVARSAEGGAAYAGQLVTYRYKPKAKKS